MQSLVKLLACLAFVSLVQGFENKNVYQYLVDNGYTLFVKYLKETGVATTLEGRGPFTVFAPTDAAIAAMDPDLKTLISTNPLQKKNFVKYHVTSNFVFVTQVNGQKNYNTLAGQTLSLSHLNTALSLNNDSMVDAAPHNDIVCLNGIVQPINKALKPPLAGGDDIAAVLIERDDLFQEFFMSILLSNMTAWFKGSEYTLFAPTNHAFGEIYKTLIGSHIPLDKRIHIYDEMVKYLLVPGARFTDALTNGQQLYTLHGSPLNISINAQGDIMANYAHVVLKDIPASNGVIHAIDHLLFPMDMLAELRQLYNQYDKPTTAAPSG